MCVCVFQVSEELKELEKSKAEKEESIKVKKQSIDLLPEGQCNLDKLQVGDLWILTIILMEWNLVEFL